MPSSAVPVATVAAARVESLVPLDEGALDALNIPVCSSKAEGVNVEPVMALLEPVVRAGVLSGVITGLPGAGV